MFVVTKESSLKVEPHECHQCSTLTNCSQLIPAKCSDEQPYCATVATAPNYTSALTCRAAQVSPCVLQYEKEYTLTCICETDLCNALYNQRLRDELLNFSTNFHANSDANFTEIFFKFSALANISNEAIYEMVTANTTASSVTMTPYNVTEELPRAEALKKATVPPDDDEDESEGSGNTTDESKPHDHASPAAPSSYLPAKENGAISLSLNLFLIIPFWYW
ncbi:unnamed protein product [Leptosia nina]|uniref:Uncharacterized protein n=1 Tax=Leptosia nina TaxID=320188 RepID=A0AAV1J9W3_9NEOP